MEIAAAAGEEVELLSELVVLLNLGRCVVAVAGFEAVKAERLEARDAVHQLVRISATKLDRVRQHRQPTRVMDRLNRSGDLYLTHTRLNDRLTLRLCVGQTNTRFRHVERAWKRIREEAEKLTQGSAYDIGV